jgi:hypothetical protein
MKRHSSVHGAIALFLLGLCPVFAHAGCTASNIAGAYGFSVEGYYVGQPNSPDRFFPVAFAGTYTFNADGTVNRSFTISIAGSIVPAKDSGTYAVNADCSGTAVFLNTPLGLETINLTIVGRGSAIHFLNATTGVALAGRMEKQ